MDPLERLNKFVEENDIDTSDPGYIEYRDALIKYHESLSTNTYGDCEVTFTYQDHHITEYSNMIFCKPEDIITDQAAKCGISLISNCESGDCKKCLGILEKGHVKDEKKHLLTDEEIDAGYVVTCGVKARSKFVQIRVDQNCEVN
tara:strand:+ start:62 stop:496 length:435 start_codon:yes stop_codon:yes gene_type:complete